MKQVFRRKGTAFTLVFCLISMGSAVAGMQRQWQRNPGPPGQPDAGPGSSDYPHAGYTHLKLGTGAFAYHLLEPADPKPLSAPVVVFLHGFGATRVQTYSAWLGHLVRKGSSVIFPIYQVDNEPPAALYVGNAIVAIRNALNALSSRDHVRPNLDQVVFIGHSIGAVIAANIAAQATESGLPVPAAILLTHAADASEGPFGVFDSLLDDADFSRIPAETMLLAVVGADDRVTYDSASRLILGSAVQVPLEFREIVSLSSDRHGIPPLQASHDAPTTWSGQNALDFYGYWKWSDALMSCAFDGVECEYCFGNTAEQTFMGHWDDGVPVVPAEVIGP